MAANDLTKLLKLEKSRKEMHPSYELRKEANVADMLNKMAALAEYRTKLQQIVSTKRAPDQPTIPFLGEATETGPFISRFAAFEPQFTETGQAQGPGIGGSIIESILSQLAPEWAGKRGAFAASLKDLEKLAFEFGGKQLTGAEAAATKSTMPFIFEDEPVFYEKARQEMEINIPTKLRSQAQSLINLGYDPQGVSQLVERVLGNANGVR